MQRARAFSLLIGISMLLVMSSGCRLHTTGQPLAAQTSAPRFTLGSTQGPLSSQAALSRGPLVLVFYRGHW